MLQWKAVYVLTRFRFPTVAQKLFLALRALATKYSGQISCIAVSHSSPRATQKWLDLLGGSWSVQVVIDEDRAVYAAWGLGLGSVWSVLNPATQVQSWKEKGWLGVEVAGALGRTWVGGGIGGTNASATGGRYTMSSTSGGGGAASRKNSVAAGEDGEAAPVVGSKSAAPITTGGTGVIDGVRDPSDAGPSTIMGNKWQESGAWVVDGAGKIVWGCKARSADHLIDLEEGIRALGIAAPSS